MFFEAKDDTMVADTMSSGGGAGGDGLIGQASPAGSANVVISAGDSDFQEKVLLESDRRPVIVDFWAPWCNPCKQLTPLLERLVRGARGSILLVKVNVDENQMIASQLRVQSIPMVYAFYRGQAVDGFAGNVGEAQVKALIDKLLQISGGGQALQGLKELLEGAHASRSAKDFTSALEAYSIVLKQDPENIEAIAGLLHCYIGLGQGEQAEQMLQNLPSEISQNAGLLSVHKMLSLQSSGGAGDLSSLALAAADKSNLQACFDYACARFSGGEEAEAMQDLLDICGRDMQWQEGAARLKLLEFFEALGGGDERVVQARRQLSSLLFA